MKLFYFSGGVQMKHLGTKKLETDRLVLRRFVIEDADAMFK
jgi:ribosomal-protein-alanine N-acetyltransferase